MDHSAHSTLGYSVVQRNADAEHAQLLAHGKVLRAEAVAGYCRAFMYGCFGFSALYATYLVARIVQMFYAAQVFLP